MKEILKCFCGKEFEFDWSKIPVDAKFVYIHCIHCGTELKRKNPFNEQ